jgi:hypothetical protein
VQIDDVVPGVRGIVSSSFETAMARDAGSANPVAGMGSIAASSTNADCAEISSSACLAAATGKGSCGEVSEGDSMGDRCDHSNSATKAINDIEESAMTLAHFDCIGSLRYTNTNHEQ